MTSKPFKAAVIQQAIESNDKLANFEKAADFIRQAAAQGVELIVMQELHATQYFCQQENPDVFDLAEPLDGPSFQAYAALAAELDVVLVISQFERRAAGLYHNTAQVIDGVKGRAGIFRKMHIPDDPGFYEKFYFTPGENNTDFNGFAPIETRLGRLGVLICWDQWYPEAARLMALAGADFLVYPTAIGWHPAEEVDENTRQLEAWITVQRAHAIANGIPTLVANRTGFEADPVGADGIQFWGNSFIVGPQGEFLVHANADAEGVFTASIIPARTEAVRRMWPYLRDRRIDAYQGLTSRWLADKKFT
ncbi:MAG: carbon-nitrogen hydrolase [Marinagarivorans sp.]|nr:carbon-nitrogen hydrolase [Marinagarivorans sp.]